MGLPVSLHHQEFPMLMQNMDQALEEKPELEICGKELELLKLQSTEIGKTVQLTCMATITEASQERGEDGIPRNCVTFELSNIAIEEPEADPLAMMYPNSPSPVQ